MGRQKFGNLRSSPGKSELILKIANRSKLITPYSVRKEDPLVLIECKRWREDLEKPEHHEQLAGYIFQKGVDLGILTNGKTWYFYLAYKTGVSWRDRQVLPPLNLISKRML